MTTKIVNAIKAAGALFVALVLSHWLIGGQAAIVDGPPDPVPTIIQESSVSNFPTLPRTLRGFQEAFDNLPARDWGGADIGVTTVLRDNRAVWFFGDTLTKRGGIVWLNRNTALVQTGKTMHAVNDGVQIIPSVVKPDGRVFIYWPIKVKETKTDGIIKVWTMKIRVNGSGFWDFERVRPGESRVARIAVNKNGNMTFKSWMKNWVPEPTDSSAAVTDGSDARPLEQGHWAYMTIEHHDLPLQDGKVLVTESQNWESEHFPLTDYRPFLYARQPAS